MASAAETIVDDDTTATGTTTADTKAADTATVTDAKGGKTAAADTAADTKTDTKTAANDDWRSEFAGEDADLLKYLGRFASKTAALADAKKIHGEIRAGKYLKPPGDDATEEQQAAWRKAMGVPEKPEGYLESLPDGLVVGDDDRPFVDQFTAKMHEAGAPKEAVAAALGTYYAIVEDQIAGEAEAAADAKRECEDALRVEYGGDYRRNETALANFVGTLPEVVRDAFDKGVGHDGIPLGYKPEFRRWLIGQALEANPLATVVPGAADQASAVVEEIAKIEKMMRDNRKAYNDDEKIQARYRELITARDKIK